MRALGLAMAMAIAAAGCTPDFESSTTVKDLRLLVVMANPPEVLVDLPALSAAAAAGDTATLEAMIPTFTLEALVMDPVGAGRPIQYQASACGNDPLEGSRSPTARMGRVGATVAQAPCARGSALVAEGSVVPGPDGSVLLPVTFTPTVALLMEAARRDPLGLELGLPLKISYVIRAGNEEVVTVKRVIFSPRLSSAQTPNANPRIQSLRWRTDRSQEDSLLDEATPLPVARGTKLYIRPVFDPAEAEPYEARSFSTAERRFITESIPAEILRFSFFATKGSFSPGGTNTDPSPLRTGAMARVDSVYEAPWDVPDPADRLVQIIVVVRDERAGASVKRARLLLE